MMEGKLRSAFDRPPKEEEIERVDMPQDGVVDARKPGRPKGSANKTAPSREDTVHIGGQFREQVAEQLADIQFKRRKKTKRKVTIQGLVGEALNLLFHQEDKPQIAREK